MVGAGVRPGNTRQFMQWMEEIVLKFSSLVTAYTGWKSKLWSKIIVNLFSHCSCYLFLGWVGLCKPSEVNYQQNVLKSLLAFLQREEVYGHHHKRGSCRDSLHWCFRRALRLLLLDAATCVAGEVLDFLLLAICTKVTHFNVELLVNQLFKLCGQY